MVHRTTIALFGAVVVIAIAITLGSFHFKSAVEKYMKDLVEANADRSLFNDSLKGKPELI